MSAIVGAAFHHEMNQAKIAYEEANYQAAFHHLERAHILGQRHLVRHWISHWWMLKVGLKRRSKREVGGQLTRLFAVVPGFLFGWIPKGNTGGTNVSAVRPMPLPQDLDEIIGPFNVWHDVLVRAGLLAVILLMVLV